MRGAHRDIEAFKETNLAAHLVQGENAGFVAVVEVGGGVGDLIGEVDELGFERRPLIEQVGGEFRMLAARSSRASA